MVAGTPPSPPASSPAATAGLVGPPVGPPLPSFQFCSPQSPLPNQVPPPVAGGAEDPSTHPITGEGPNPLAAGSPGEDVAFLSEIGDVLLGSGDDGDASFWAFVSSKLGGNRAVDHDEPHEQTREAMLVPEESRSWSFLDQFEVFDTSRKHTPAIRLQDKDTARIFDQSIVPMQTWRNDPTDLFSEFSFYSDSSEDFKKASRKRKRKRDFAKQLVSILRNLLKRAIEKQEKMQRQLIEAIEKMEKARTTREEAWRHQCVELTKREMELRIRERMVAASREQALISFVKKMSGQETQMPRLAELSQIDMDQTISFSNLTEAPHMDIDLNNKRWKKCEVQALIKLRASMEDKFQGKITRELWEEISSKLSSMGYNWSAQRCREKWYNINNYFKSAKASNMKRPHCRWTSEYFHELEILHTKGALDPDAKVIDEPAAAYMDEIAEENINYSPSLPFTSGNASSLGENLNLTTVQHDDSRLILNDVCPS